MLTLTLRHSRTLLVDQIKRLYVCFNNLRRRQAWRDHVVGGVAFLELKVSERDDLWHVHLHVLCEGSFWDQREISREWHAVTGDSSIVDVRRVQDGPLAAVYVTKYVTKPADNSVFARREKLDEIICSLRGTKLCLPFGTWRSLKLMEKPKADVAWISVGSISNLQRRARENDVEAIRFLEAAARKWPLFATLFGDRVDSS